MGNDFCSSKKGRREEEVEEEEHVHGDHCIHPPAPLKAEVIKLTPE
jgi:hypothetical protein